MRLRLERVLPFWHARRLGRRDGRAGVPAPSEGTTHPPYLRQIGHNGQQAVGAIAQNWANEDKKYKSQHCRLQRKLEHANQAVELAEEELIRAELVRSASAEENLRRELRRSQRAESELKNQLERGAKQAEEHLRSRLDAVAKISASELRSRLEQISTTGSQLRNEMQASVRSAEQELRRHLEQSQEAEETLHARLQSLTLAIEEKLESPSDNKMPPLDGRPSGTAPLTRRVWMPLWLYWPVLVLLFVGEFPLNRYAFRIFGEPQFDTNLMTLSVAIPLLVTAHGLGILLAQNRATARDRVWIRMLIGLPIGLVLSVALIRQAYLVAIEIDFLSNITSIATFSVINIFVYAAASLLSYMAHDPEGEARRHAEKSLQKEQRRVGLAKRHRALPFQKEGGTQALTATAPTSDSPDSKDGEAPPSRESPIEPASTDSLTAGATGRDPSPVSDHPQTPYVPETATPDQATEDADRGGLRGSAHDPPRINRERVILEAAKSRMHEIDEDSAALAAHRLKRQQAVRALAELRISYFNRLMEEYCGSNQLAREDGQFPSILATIPAIELPSELLAQHLDWQCNHRLGRRADPHPSHADGELVAASDVVASNGSADAHQPEA